MRGPRPMGPRPGMHRPRWRRPVHRPPGWRPGPRRNMYRPPWWRPGPRDVVVIHRPPRDFWWSHRPPHRRGRYRGYYNGRATENVLATLLAAGIIHSALTSGTNITNYNDIANMVETKGFIPQEAVSYNGRHYHVFSDVGNSLEDAQQFCESMGGHLATVGDEAKNAELFRLINNSGYENESFEKTGMSRVILEEPVTYEAAPSGDDYYGMYYWKYENILEDGTSSGAGGNAFVCEWDS